ncbi:MAG TPA: glycosyltransferase family 39 protein [Longimicrobiales bacterium]|nr:glycosyltransferase family 39 protein [Longimicrobiales bacterium]
MSDRARTRWVLLGVAVLVECVLVAGAFNPAPHTGGDNAGYVGLAHALLTTGSYVELFDPAGAPHTKYPPVFPAVLALLVWLGARSWVALKSIAAVSTVVTVAFTYLWAQRRIGSWAALAVAVLVGASSAVVYYSRWVLSDPLFVALTMVALWALDREDVASADSGGRWLVVGVAAAGLAYFTRSAGLPLVTAILAWLLWRRRWRALAATGAALGIPAIAWWARGLGVPGSYSTEFWLVDPYAPTLGTIGLGALVPRAISNLFGYVLQHGPGGIVGARGAWVSLLGVVLVAGALYGWLSRVRSRPGPAELFFPLYAGLILLWPTVWSGDRFALPLYPLVFFYGALALADLRARLPAALGSLAVAGVVLAAALPAARSWAREVGTARACARVVAAQGAFACYGPRVGAFVTAAEWARAALPDDARVLTRKPRIFYALSGVPSRTFPFDDDPDVLLAAADEAKAAYVLLDEWDGLAGAYVGGAVRRRPEAFCFVRSFGRPGSGGAQLLGVLPPAERSGRVGASAEEVGIVDCPAGYAPGGVPAHPSSSPTAIPLLEGAAP